MKLTDDTGNAEYKDSLFTVYNKMNKNETFTKKFFKEFNSISIIERDCYCMLEENIVFENFDSQQYYSLENELPRKISFVCEGILRIFHLDSEGKEWNKHFFKENDFFSSSPNPEIRSTTRIQALTNTQLVSIPIILFTQLSKQYRQIDQFIQKLLSTVIENEKEKGLMLMSLSAQNKYEYFSGKFPQLENQIQHYHIASYLGITPTQLSRIRKKNKSHQQM